jgi:hypothetical protein
MKEIELINSDVAIVDDCDYNYLDQFSWYYDGEHVVRFAYVKEIWTKIYMFEEVMRRMEE